MHRRQEHQKISQITKCILNSSPIFKSPAGKCFPDLKLKILATLQSNTTETWLKIKSKKHLQ
ncbi:MAG TPA: hypothetical protein DCQ10_01420 [Rhodobacteraceae bacterium]|nr:hypothetical protein [Paracoccaceae bacterium]